MHFLFLVFSLFDNTYEFFNTGEKLLGNVEVLLF